MAAIAETMANIKDVCGGNKGAQERAPNKGGQDGGGINQLAFNEGTPPTSRDSRRQ